jgi:tRNA-specific 2-thiouridylase
MESVLVGMSGGVDSSVAAYLLKENGYLVEGVSFVLWDVKNRGDSKSCCSLAAVEDARQTARILDIQHHTVDARGEFSELVIDNFVGQYNIGRTPNPCVLCNRFVKFPMLLSEAQKRGLKYIATGHYANIQTVEEGKRVLKKALDQKKDQSYFLYVLGRECLQALALPLGGYFKTGVRDIAKKLELPAARRAESQDICFVERGGYGKFIRELNGDAHAAALAAGPIIDTQGRRVGTHGGLYAFTIGQRRGTGVAAGEPLYVTAIDTASNTLVVGRRDEVFSAGFEVGGINWLIPPEEVFAGGTEAAADVKFRSNMKEQPATLRVLAADADVSDEAFKIVAVKFLEPQWAAAAGQSAVFYRGGTVLGGGIIV